MASKTKVPEPSEEERALQRNQAELLAQQREIIEDQRRQNAILLPFLAAQEGFIVNTDDQGNILSVSITPEETSARAQEKEIARLFGERSLAALRGELPIDPGLEKDLEVGERDLRSQLTQQFGPGYETSTPGIQALEEFRRSAEILRFGARTGQLTLAEQLGITREQQQQFRRQTSGDVLTANSIGNQLTLAGALGQTAKGFGQAQIPFIEDRKMRFGASQTNAGITGNIIGAGLGAIGAFFSDEEGKADKVKIAETLDGINVYEYTHKGTGERMIGVIASEVEKVRPWAVYHRLGRDAVSYRELE